MTKTLVAGTILSLLTPIAVAQQRVQHLDILSATSLRLEILHDDVSLGSATGFVLKKKDQYWLITNRHVVLGCSPDKNPSDVGGWVCANKLGILQNKEGHVGEWLWTREELYQPDGRSRRWHEHPQLNGSVDLIALPLAVTTGVAFYPLDLELRKTQLMLHPGDQVSIVGFPFGISQAGGLAIWKNGTLASDTDVDFDGRAKFLLDATGRPGMSGSPVYARRSGAYQQEDNITSVGTATKFLGVYSEENQAAELGAVWKAEVVVALYDSLP
jgi:Trypsin-like peptidase domain